ncbi:DoxX family protein [Methylobacterium sp. P31]
MSTLAIPAAGSAAPARSRAESLALLALRLCLVPLFYYSGVGKVMNFTATAARLTGSADVLGSVLTAGAIAIELGVSTALLLGIFARSAALVLIVFTAAATLMFHKFWASPDGQVVMQTINFLKNLGLIGGLFVIFAFGPGPWAIRSAPRGSAR